MKKRKAKLKSGTRQYVKREVTLPQCPWDMGADGPANREGLHQEEATDVTPDGETPNPNRVTRMRRKGLLEEWHGNYVKGARGKTGVPLVWITTRQYNAATALRDAWEATGKSPGWPDNDRVQSSPKPDHAVTIQIDRLSKYHRIAKHVPRGDQAILAHCVISGQAPKGNGWEKLQAMDHLRAALERLATALEKNR